MSRASRLAIVLVAVVCARLAVDGAMAIADGTGAPACRGHKPEMQKTCWRKLV
ncbi:hypothetical protein [Massilia sp. CT11-137]|uniref:hypothetical protein n=1 Tax=Massilia sp. CT11-137 TaxID=3393901 RepID=UPI0039A69A2C